MNIKLMYGAGGFLLGGLLGGGLTFVINRGLKERVRELEIQNEDLIKENRKHAHRSHRGREKCLKTQSSNGINVTDPFKPKDESFDRVEKERRERETQLKTDYVKLSQQYRSDDFDRHFETRVGPTDEDDDIIDESVEDDEDEDGDDIAVIEYQSGNPNGEIRMISSKQFRDDLNYRENETIIYYQEDDVLTTAKNEVISNQEKVIGSECMGMICDTMEEYLYIDNEIDDKLYEVIVNHDDSFYRDIMSNPINYADDEDDE